MSNLLLGVRTSLYDFKKIKLENVDFDSKVENFKCEVSRKANIPKDSLELVYCGNILSDDSTLRGSGIKPGVMVHVLKKKTKELPHPTVPMSEADIQALVVAFRTLTLTPSYRTSLQKLSRPDILDNIIMITPGLSQDPVAISMIQDPELLVRMGDIETVRRIVELHPALAEAANHIAAAAHEEAVSSNNCGPSTSAGFSQLMDVLSDEDDMESSQGVSRQQSFSAITPAQLAAALASASQGSSPATAALGGNAVNSIGGGSGETSSAITPEMVNEAMQRAMATVAPNSRLGTNSEGTSQEGNNDLTEQMRQMRELGLTDDVINLQALQLAGGNVHAAIDLVFSGAISSEHQ
ncbi:ubiquitin-like protein 7 isoform X2 [Rhodnius prolixus]|uniref:ubiquitin-like protein 7 isoform X2 n=1 Tax=Rhodnius prolixus TaxID=13249 RepID=UPI003D189E55